MKRTAAFLAAIACLFPFAFAQSKKAPRPFAELTEAETAALDRLGEFERIYADARLNGSYAIPRLDVNSESRWKRGMVGVLADRSRRTFTTPLNQVIDERNILVRGSNIWVEGIDARNLTDGSSKAVDLSGIVFAVAGTKSYETVIGGSRTVRHIVAVDAARADEAVRSIIQPRGFRFWTNTNGENAIARFSRKSGSDITLRLPSGEPLKLRADQLSDADREWLKEHPRGE